SLIFDKNSTNSFFAFGFKTTNFERRSFVSSFILKEIRLLLESFFNVCVVELLVVFKASVRSEGVAWVWMNRYCSTAICGLEICNLETVSVTSLKIFV